MMDALRSNETSANVRRPMKKYLPFGLAVLAFLLASWWAWTTWWDTVEGDEELAARAPLIFETPDPDPPDRAATPEPEERTPAPTSRPPIPPAPPERIVPETVPPEDGDDSDGAEPDLEDPSSADQRDRPAGGQTAGARPHGFVGGVARPADRATQEIEVPEGTAWIGTPLKWAQRRSRTPEGEPLQGILDEVPRHAVRVDRFWIDRFEVTNHRYWQYLARTAWVEFRTSLSNAATLPQFAKLLIRHPPDNLDFDLVGRQLFESNFAALRKPFLGLLVKGRDGLIDMDATWVHVRDRRVPGGVKLRFFDRAPPATWIGDRYPEDEPDHPVRGLALEEALEYALYRGRHIPTEIEWEYAARGPKGLDYPWGGQGRGFPARVNGGTPLTRGAEPKTVPAAHLIDGASWVGCLNMLGNVSEWTSSWLAPYPGAEPGLEPYRWLVVRGGSAFDQERVAVRPALRGWMRGRPAGGPRPRNRLPWTGFRTARYEEAGRSRLPTMQYRALSYGLLAPEALAPPIYEAVQGVLTDAALRTRHADLDTRPGVKTFVGHPLAAMAIRPPGGAGRLGAVAYDGLPTEAVLHALSESSGPLLFGLFHNDLILTNTWRTRGGPGPHQLEAPGRFLRADCPPGTWFVGLLHRQLALIRPDLEMVYYLTTRDAPKALFALKRMAPVKTKRRPLVSLRLQGSAERVDVDLTVPLGEKRAADYVAVIRLMLRTDTRETGAVPSWERSNLR